MQLQFMGAVRTVTGSMHIVETNGRRILLDCGLYQGKRKEAFERNRHLPFDSKSIDAMILSHAHIDHAGNIPQLVKDGFAGNIYCTSATRDLAAVMLRDSAHIQLRDVEYVNKKRAKQGKNLFEPLYTLEDVRKSMDNFVGVAYNRRFSVTNNVTGRFLDAGHILGSAVTVLDITENGRTARLAFTGDLGRKNYPILRDPVPADGPVFYITETTYGDRAHPATVHMEQDLADLVQEAVQRGGKIVIPAFSLGRTQNIVYAMHKLFAEGRIPHIKIFVDSPLSTNVTEVFKMHEECYDREAVALTNRWGDAFSFPLIKYITDVEESKALNTLEGTCVIISASGMCEAGRILHHLKNNISDEANTILIVGYQAENTLGRRLVEKAREIKIFGEVHPVRAQVRVMNGLSAHADRNGLFEYFIDSNGRVERVFAVHGELDQTMPFADRLREAGAKHVEVPEPGQCFMVEI